MNFINLIDKIGAASIAAPIIMIIVLAVVLKKEKLQSNLVLFALYIYFMSFIQAAIILTSIWHLHNHFIVLISIPLHIALLAAILRKTVPQRSKFLFSPSWILTVFSLISIVTFAYQWSLFIPIGFLCITIIYLSTNSLKHLKEFNYLYFINIGLIFYSFNNLFFFGLINYYPKISVSVNGFANIILNYFYMRGLICYLKQK